MSLNVIPLETQKVIPPVFDYKQKKLVEIVDGGENVLFTPFTASNSSSNSITVKCDPPSRYTVVDNNIMQYAEIVFTLVATNTDVVPRKIFEDFGTSAQETAPRSYPLARCTQNAELIINSTSFSSTPYQHLDAILKYGYIPEEQERGLKSVTPTMLDNTYDYALSYNRPSRDVMNGNYYESGEQTSRGAFCDFQVLTNPVILPGNIATATLKLIIQEPIMVSPLYYQSSGLIQCTTMTYNFTYGDLSRMICRRATLGLLGNPLAITSYGAVINIFQLWAKFYTPKLLDSVPKNSVYDYYEIGNYGSNEAQASLPAGASSVANMNSVNLSSIPSRIYFYVGENLSEKSFSAGGLSKPDVSNALITGVSVQWLGQAGYLSTLTSRQLYEMSCNNGLKQSWSEFSKFNGSWCCLDVSKDLGLKSNMVVSLLTNPQFNMNVSYTNISNRPIKFTLYVRVISEGIATNMNGVYSKQTGIFSQMDSIKSFSEVAVVEDKSVKNSLGGIIGGRGLGGFNPLLVASLVKSLVKGATDVADVVNPIAKRGVQLAEDIGLGMEEEEDSEELRRELNKKYLSKGGKLRVKGGRFISRNDLY